jgi:sugar transferase (PEP-CTERM/EpsH1 system associated)
VRILFLTHRLPYAPNRGDRIRSHHLLRVLANRADVDLVSLVHDADEASHVADLEGLAATVTAVRVPRLRNLARAIVRLPGARPTTHTLLDGPGLRPAIARVTAAHAPDVVFAYCTGIAWVALEPPLAARPLVLDMVDVDSAKWEALGAAGRGPRAWVYRREARCLSAFERDVTRRARATMVVTPRERETLAALAPGARIEVVGNGVDLESLRPAGGPSSEPVVVFCGVMDYEPNVMGAVWLARDVWPIVRHAHPAARLRIVGADPVRAVRECASAERGIEVTGRVPDVRPYLWSAAVAAAPLQTARGVQNKVLEALAAGLPVVVTPVVAAGLPVEAAGGCEVAGDAEAFAAALVRLLGAPAPDRRHLAGRADLDGLSWASRLEPAWALIEEAAGRTGA